MVKQKEICCGKIVGFLPLPLIIHVFCSAETICSVFLEGKLVSSWAGLLVMVEVSVHCWWDDR